jgi:hypothetical protein
VSAAAAGRSPRSSEVWNSFVCDVLSLSLIADQPHQIGGWKLEKTAGSSYQFFADNITDIEHTQTHMSRASTGPSDGRSKMRAAISVTKGAQTNNSQRNEVAEPVDNVNNGHHDWTESAMEYLAIAEPFPMEPPSYASTLPRVHKPAFDSLDPLNEFLPTYQPTVYKIGIFYRKMEWISPYEMASQRHWKPYIVELNNTQINFYQCPFKTGDPMLKKFEVSSSFSGANSHSLLHPYHYHHIRIKQLQGLTSPTAIDPNDPNDGVPYHEDNFRSIMTTKTDLKALRYFKSINALESTKIVRSYTLQYGRVGLAIDYKKKTHVFRCRFETEQFLMDFQSAEGMIEWYNAISLGADNALDLARREMPSYKTVPRRRRRRFRHNTTARSVAAGLGLTSSNIVSDSPRRVSTRKSSSNITIASTSPSPSASTSNVNGDASKLFSKVKSFETLFKSRRGSASSPTPLGTPGSVDSHGSAGSASSSTGILLAFRRNKSKNDMKSPNRDNTIPAKSISPPYENKTSNRPAKLSVNGTARRSGDTARIDMELYGMDGDMDYGDDGEGNVDDDDDEFVDDDEDEFQVEENRDDGEDESDVDSEEQGSGSGSNDIVNAMGSLGLSEAGPGDNISNSNVADKQASFFTGRSILSVENMNNYPLRSYKEYITKPTTHPTKAHTYPAQRKILRDSMRCMVPLTENERWSNKFVLLDKQKFYKPQSKQAVEKHNQSYEIMTHVSTVGMHYVHRFRRPLQEWIVTPSGLIPYMNPNAAR